MIIEIKARLEALVAVFPRYAVLARKTTDEVLDQKGRDLGIRLFQGFRAQRWGGSTAQKGRDLALAELKQRTLAGKGTTVRPSLLRRYEEKRRELAGNLSGIFDAAQSRAGSARVTLRDFSRRERRQRDRIRGKRANLWRATIGREIRARARGIGVLGASFLWFRKRFSKGQINFARNRSGVTLGYVERDAAALRIVGLREGLDVIDARADVVAGALAGALADINTYLDRYTAAFVAAERGGAAA